MWKQLFYSGYYMKNEEIYMKIPEGMLENNNAYFWIKPYMDWYRQHVNGGLSL